MNEKALRYFRVWDKLDKTLSKRRITGDRRMSMYPSEASVITTDPETGRKDVMGGCLRKSWYRLMNFPKTEPFTLKTLHTFEFGNYVETYIKDLVAKAGVFDNSSVKFWDKASGVSGELDITLDVSNEPGVLKLLSEGENSPYIIAEVKSTWGGRLNMHNEEAGPAKGLFDHHEGRGAARAMVKAKPKEGNLLQLVTYLFKYKDDPNLLGGKLMYMLRDNLNRTEFDVVLVKEGDKHRVSLNGEIIKDYFVEDIYERFQWLAQRINSDVSELRKTGKSIKSLTPPDRDYILKFTVEQAEELNTLGKLSDTQLKNCKAGKNVGNWNCSYCSYKSLCYEMGDFSKYMENTDA